MHITLSVVRLGMDNLLTNININLTNSSIFEGSEITLVKDFGDGHKAFANNSGSAVAIFAEMEEEGDFFNISGWHKHPKRTLEEIADSLYA